MVSNNWMVSSAKTGKGFFAPNTVTPPRIYPVSGCTSLIGTISARRPPAAAASFLKSSSSATESTAKTFLASSTRHSSVLNTCSGGRPIFFATVCPERSSGSTVYYRVSYAIPRATSRRQAFVFTPLPLLRQNSEDRQSGHPAWCRSSRRWVAPAPADAWSAELSFPRRAVCPGPQASARCWRHQHWKKVRRAATTPAAASARAPAPLAAAYLAKTFLPADSAVDRDPHAPAHPLVSFSISHSGSRKALPYSANFPALSTRHTAWNRDPDIPPGCARRSHPRSQEPSACRR